MANAELVVAVYAVAVPLVAVPAVVVPAVAMFAGTPVPAVAVLPVRNLQLLAMSSAVPARLALALADDPHVYLCSILHLRLQLRCLLGLWLQLHLLVRACSGCTGSCC